VIEPFEKAIGRKILGNYPASGTEIIKELGAEHVATGRPIVYTSADSVFQIACHEEVVPIEQLYELCRIARRILVGPHCVSREIARPFTGPVGNLTRTERRRDFSIPPLGRTLLDAVSDAGGDVIAVGKIEDIFAGRGVTEAIHTGNNDDGTTVTIDIARSGRGALVFTNLVDFDMLYGHRNVPDGYARALQAFDARIPDILASLRGSDLLIITADHGCDPTTPGTDHTREYAPLLVYGPSLKGGVDLGVRESFCDIAASVSDILGLPGFACGRSFTSRLY
jgi:phosphopentomutase